MFNPDQVFSATQDVLIFLGVGVAVAVYTFGASMVMGMFGRFGLFLACAPVIAAVAFLFISV